MFIRTNDGKFLDRYRLHENLGSGSFGEVYKVTLKGVDCNDFRAVKIISKANMAAEEEENFKYEVSILKNLDHPNILKLYEIFEDEESYYLVTELC